MKNIRPDASRQMASLSARHMAVILLTAAFVVLVGIKKPYYNWDVIGYVAAAHFEDGLRGTELRDRTYGERYFIFSASLLLLGIFDVVAGYGVNKSNRANA